jgi:hypothetical protein
MKRIVFDLAELPDPESEEAQRREDEYVTGRVRCIGCGKFVARERKWNQCADCDTRYPEEM